MSDDTRERIAALEVQVKHLAETLDKTNDVVTELRDLLLQAKGARWLLGILIAIGGFTAGIAAKYLPFLPR
ncbi:hypothetical protein [Microvirga lotononidis]|uniref:Uncharacterized protein n=1 Tax=Microvirga lotononidis TaxID=864069 RepID=I4YP73_9HYPH|nr:hypothetical protein [Microvirga lotononidis]EIM25765.1 hypothetical protein MicloDRAFT_00064920 [Microvirga lotononidis]WQO25692.1 hypothetical protein U0023_13290 [Microvirga lotononidis]